MEEKNKLNNIIILYFKFRYYIQFSIYNINYFSDFMLRYILDNIILKIIKNYIIMYI